MFADDFLPTYDVSDAVGVVVDAAPYATVDRDQFRDFEDPCYAKTVYELSVCGLDDVRTLLSAMMHTATTGEHARRWFRRPWTLGVGSGAHVVVNGVLEQAREGAEQGRAA